MPRLNNLFFFIVIDTCFVLWLLSSFNNIFFTDVIETCEEKLALSHVVKYESIKWLFTDCFCLIIWYSTGSWTWTSLWVFLNNLDCEFHLTKLVTLILFKSTFFSEHFYRLFRYIVVLVQCGWFSKIIVLFSVFMVIQAYCIIFLKLTLQRLFQNLAERLKLEIFAKIINSFKVVETFLDNYIKYSTWFWTAL